MGSSNRCNCKRLSCLALLIALSFGIFVGFIARENDAIWYGYQTQAAAARFSTMKSPPRLMATIADRLSVQDVVGREDTWRIGEPSPPRNDNSSGAQDSLTSFLEQLSEKEIRSLFHRLLTTVEVKCARRERFGAASDGGYETCQSGGLKFEKDSCLVYSIGIRNDWSFDDDVYKKYNCTVHSFDPSMKMNDHTRLPKVFFHNVGIWKSDTYNEALGWKMMTLSSIRSSLGHEKAIIDVIKMDVEGSEWQALGDWLRSGSLTSVKQLSLEVHTPTFRRPMTARDYAAVYETLAQLKALGFRLYYHLLTNDCRGRFGPFAADEKGRIFTCYELFYLNTNYL